jgi:predicted nucleic acid-binding protein
MCFVSSDMEVLAEYPWSDRYTIYSRRNTTRLGLAQRVAAFVALPLQSSEVQFQRKLHDTRIVDLPDTDHTGRPQPRVRLRLRYDDKPRISFTGLASFVVTSELGIHRVLTGDAHFEQVGLGFIRLP